MTKQTTLPELMKQAHAAVDAVADDPAGRYRLREDFYRKYGFGQLETAGFGTSELAFLRWEIRRGVLNATGDPALPGSPWWREVNSDFLYVSELAALVHEAGLPPESVERRVRFWLDYFAHPSPESWYRAHNASIVGGYLSTRAAARNEAEAEQLFMNEVLYRLVFAQGMVTGAVFGELGDILANPNLPAVEVIVNMAAFYPAHYPMTAEEVRDVEHLSDTIEDILAKILDEDLILPHIDKLYTLVGGVIEQPDLPRLLRDGKPIYPDIDDPSEPVASARFQLIASLPKSVDSGPVPAPSGPQALASMPVRGPSGAQPS